MSEELARAAQRVSVASRFSRSDADDDHGGGGGGRGKTSLWARYRSQIAPSLAPAADDERPLLGQMQERDSHTQELMDREDRYITVTLPLQELVDREDNLGGGRPASGHRAPGRAGAAAARVQARTRGQLARHAS